jgi:hypothetical protein
MLTAPRVPAAGYEVVALKIKVHCAATPRPFLL